MALFDLTTEVTAVEIGAAVTDFHSFQITAEKGRTGSPYSVRIDREGEVEDTTSLQADNWSESIWSQDADIIDKLQHGERWGLQNLDSCSTYKVIDAAMNQRVKAEILIRPSLSRHRLSPVDLHPADDTPAACLGG